MRKQYFFRTFPRGPLAWDVDHLIALTAHLPRRMVPLTHIRELDAAWAGMMDGMHRVAKALLLSRTNIEAVQSDADPPADHVGKGPTDLPYDRSEG